MPTRDFQEAPIEDEVIGEEGKFSKGWEEWIQDLTINQKEIQAWEIILSPGSIASNFSTTVSFSITQIKDDDGNAITVTTDDIVCEAGDYVLQLIKPTLTAGIIVGAARITGVNTLDVEYTNVTGGSINPGTETYTLIVLKGK